MVQVDILGGIGEIGGNKFLVEDSDSRILLDFGMSLGARGLVYLWVRGRVLRRTGLWRLGSFRSLGVFESRSLRLETCFRRFLQSHPGDRPEPSAQPVRQSIGTWY